MELSKESYVFDSLIDSKFGVGSSRRLQSFRSDWSGCYLLIPNWYCGFILF